MIDIFKRTWKKTIGIVIFLVVWEMVTRFGLVDAFILPPVSEVIAALFKMLLSGELFVHIGSSLGRTGSGFVLALLVGIPLGILMGWFLGFEQIVDPLIQLFRNTSVLAMYPIFILVFGLGEASKIAIVFWGSIWTTLISTIGGVKSIDPLLVKSARSMGISELALFRKVVLPASLPAVLTGIRLSAGVAIIILVAAEMLGASKGLGFLIFYSEQKYDIPNMYAGIITISLLGVLINNLLVLLEKHLTAWKEQVNNA